MKDLTVGIDTSNYTTSIAVVDHKGNLVLDERKILHVGEGKRGLRQSDALFQHVVNLPILFEKFKNKSIGSRIKTVSVSSRPRPVKDSYMPVFRAGQSFGKSIANILNCEYKEFSHQEGHIEAVKWSLERGLKDEFLALHLSGGTTEIVKVKKTYKAGYDIDIVGGTSDISAGQFIDRIGVKMGLKFPAGREMDRIANDTINNKQTLSTSLKSTYISFSGPETAAYRLINQNEDKTTIATAVFRCIAHTLKKAIEKSCEISNLSQVVFIGGVSSSQYIRKYLSKEFLKKDVSLYFGDAIYCTDNAVGTALLGIDE